MLRRPIDFSRRTPPHELPERIDESCSDKDMRVTLRDLERVNRWFLGYRPTLDWLASLDLNRGGERVRILDVGCGYGDTLRQIKKWAHNQGVAVELTGLDMNPDCVSIAADAGALSGDMHWVAGDVFDYRPPKPPHLVISSLFTHHLEDAQVVRFLRWMEANAAAGWYINDLSRARIPYFLFGWFARVAGLHPFVQHDGPVSFARAFRSDDWRRLCAEAGLADGAVEIRAWKPARLCVGRRKR